MIRWDRRDPKIDRFLFNFHLDAAVLGQTLLGDAHRTGHDLEPADNGRLQTLGWRLHFLQHTIDPKTNAEFFIERFEMNIARTHSVGLDQQHRDQANDRSVG